MSTTAPTNKPEAEPLAASERLAYTAAELVIALGVSRVTLWRLQARGLLRPVPGLRRKLFSVAEVNRFLSGGGDR